MCVTAQLLNEHMPRHRVRLSQELVEAVVLLSIDVSRAQSATLLNKLLSTFSTDVQPLITHTHVQSRVKPDVSAELFVA